MTGNLIKIGTRGSALALWQANWVKSLLEGLYPGLTVELVIIKTTGDKILDVPLAKVGGKGLFVKELEEAMLAGEVDLAVHSMKDVPTFFPEGLGLSVILPREDPRDALLSVEHDSLEGLPQGGKVGSSSLRRQSQLMRLRPDLEVVSLRGNVDTRIRKLEEGQFDAIILAAAGVKRLERTERVVAYLDETAMVPAIGQGAVGIETRLDDERTRGILAPLAHPATETCVRAERALLAKLEGGCQVPIAGHALLDGETLSLTGLVGDLEGKVMLTEAQEGAAADPEALGVRVADALLAGGAKEILAAVYGAGESNQG